jgi:hypothetical protein
MVQFHFHFLIIMFISLVTRHVYLAIWIGTELSGLGQPEARSKTCLGF